MEQKNQQPPKTAEKNEDMFNEMSVVELEERLELTDRCVCRIETDPTST